MENSIADSNIYLDRSCRLSGRDELHVVELHKESYIFINYFSKKKRVCHKFMTHPLFFYLFSIFLHRIMRSYRKSFPAVRITHGFYTESGLAAIG